VNTHKDGTDEPAQRRRALTARAQDMSFLSMPDLSPSIADNIHRIGERVASAAAAAGRRVEDVTLIAVSKFHPVEQVLEALGAGQFVFGENRVQEAAGKFPALRASYPALKLHIIGPLQTNKVRDAMDVADVIETLDRPRLADALAAAVEKGAKLPQLLIQVNTGDEPQKAGIAKADADAFIAACRDRFGGNVTGLMCIPPADQDPVPHFAWLADRAARFSLPIVSMGMSADYEIAIRHGATHIRVGTAIFGAR
jgi:pyridoxal phosphate enzyme (YggS family)